MSNLPHIPHDLGDFAQRYRAPLPDCLTLFVLYHKPRDHPDHAVIRAWDQAQHSERSVPRTAALLFRELETAIAWCEQEGLTCTAPYAGEDPYIHSVWL